MHGMPAMSKIKRAIGLMSGTSMDGIDIGLIETDGEDHVRHFPGMSVAYPEAFRSRLRQALEDARTIEARWERPGCLADVERELTERHADAVRTFMGDRLLQPSAVDVIGFHGQTVLHRDQEVALSQVSFGFALPAAELARMPAVRRKLTVQIGDAALLAAKTGIDVVHDLRAADAAAGGQGAPLVPVYHRALVARQPERPIALVNIGGVGNITWIGRNGHLIAFDTGPGNGLIDDWMLLYTGTAQDPEGRNAAAGQVDADALARMLASPYFAAVPPKSLDRKSFDWSPVAHLGVADGAATLTAFTAESIAKAREHVPEQPALWVICGGGRRNRTLMAHIAARVENAVVPAEALGLDGDLLEAEAWAYLAVRSLAGLPITYPGTTGVAEPLPGGVLARAP